MIPFLTHPVECAKYIAHSFVPGIEIALLGDYYRKTGDRRVLDEMSGSVERLKAVVRKYYPRIAPERMPRVLERIDDHMELVKRY
jgi:hypothetical protein